MPTVADASTARAGSAPSAPAEEARIEALSAGERAYVKAERISLAAFLTDEWLPSPSPPVLEESTWHSYDRYLRLHVIPHIGAVPLQKLTPVDLNRLYRHLLESGGDQLREDPALAGGVRASRRAPGRGYSYEAVAELARGVRGRAEITKNAVAALLRRGAPRAIEDHPPRLGAADRALHPHDHPRRARRTRCAGTEWSQRRRRRHSPIGGRRPVASTEGVDGRNCEPSSTTPPTASSCRRGSSSPRAAAGAASASACAGPTSTSTADGGHLPPGDGARPPGDREGAAEDEAGPPHPPRLRHGGMLRRLRVDQAETGFARPGVPGRGLRVLPVRRPAPPPGAVLTGVRPQAALLQPGPPRQSAPGDHPARPPPHVGDARAERWHRHQDRQRAPQPQQHPHHAEIYTHVTPPMQSDAAERVANVIFGPTSS